MSETVAQGMRVFIKDHAADETANFIEMFDKFFDALNVTNFSRCIYKRKYFQTVYRWNKDFRLKVKTLMYMYVHVCTANTSTEKCSMLWLLYCSGSKKSF